MAAMAAALESAKVALVDKLRRHALTRGLVQGQQLPLELDQGEQELRKGLDLQRRVADALLAYAGTVARAFEAVLHALEALEDAGIDEFEDAAPLAGSLLHGARKAHEVMQGLLEEFMVPLEAHRAMLAKGEKGVAQADAAAMEHRRYQEKVEALDACSANPGSKRIEERLLRNRGKLKQADIAAQIARKRGGELLGQCRAKRSCLQQLAGKTLEATAEALRCVAEDVPGTECCQQACNLNPFDADCPGGLPDEPQALAGPHGPSEAEAGCCENPFDCDLLERDATLPSALPVALSSSCNSPQPPRTDNRGLLHTATWL